MENKVNISVIVPIYNEEKTLKNVLIQYYFKLIQIFN